MAEDPEGQPDADSSEFQNEAVTVKLFRQLELFEGLTGEECREIVQACRRTMLEPGELLFSEGDTATALYLIEAGELEVRSSGPQAGEEIVLAVLGGQTVVGEMAILEGSSPRSATVEALSETHAYVLARDRFNELRAAHRPVAYKLIMNLAKILGDRRRQTDRRVAEVFADPATHIDAFESHVHEMLGRLRKA